MNTHKGVVAAGHALTVAAASEIIKDNGNAIDAAIAALMVATVVEPVFASPGGGGFAMVHDGAHNTTRLFDFFSQTPLKKRSQSDVSFEAIHADFGPAVQEFHIGAGSTAVPGFIAGLFRLYDGYGSLPFKRLAEPAVRLAREGVEISAFQAYLFTVVAPILTHSETAKNLFAPNGNLLKHKDILKNEGLAQFYEQLVEEGLQFINEGDAASEIVNQSSEQGGLLTLNDLQSYEVIERTPLHAHYCEASVFLNPPPAVSGALIGFGLELLDKLKDLEIEPTEQMMLALKASVDIRSTSRSQLLQGAFGSLAAREFEAICKAHHPAYKGTTQISIIDSQRNAISVTVSNGEGNGLMLGEYGFMLNNMLGEEDLNETGFFTWQENCRLSSMMAPTLILGQDGEITALGSGGSNRIRSAVLQVTDHMLRSGLCLHEAISAPRLHLEKCGTLSFEDCFDEKTCEAIVSFDSNAHGWPDKNMFFGGVHAASISSDGVFDGAGDERREGVFQIIG